MILRGLRLYKERLELWDDRNVVSSYTELLDLVNRIRCPTPVLMYGL